MFDKKKLGFMAAPLLLAAVLMTLTPAVQAGTLQLVKDTAVKVKLAGTEDLTTKNATVGQMVDIVLDEDITIGGQLVVVKGAPGHAEVTEIVKPKAPGKPGKIVLTFKDLATRGSYRTVSGEPIVLSGATEMKGKGKALLAYITIVGIFLIKGGKGVIAHDQELTAFVGETVVLSNE